ncbi:hypothetical protein E2C01_077038 [Portunus trituberculatus]|uniref:Uncharacterized protein n=1 Tax=Portunus trituberculatus TaxID=210409 RepID=A0A5B7IJ71_PORTR|nr:hypothetical protein [Portunus trituberculatus]
MARKFKETFGSMLLTVPYRANEQGKESVKAFTHGRFDPKDEITLSQSQEF